MFKNRDRLVIFDADGTLVNAFPAVELAFSRHQMDIGDLERFQRRRKLLKYLGGLREFPKNLRRQLDKDHRKQFKHTLTATYRAEAELFPGVAALLMKLIEAPDVRVGIVSRNITIEPAETLRIVLQRHGIAPEQLDFLHCIPLGESKAEQFRAIRTKLDINPARSYTCGDEYRDYSAAIEAGLHPLVVAYGFEDYQRLSDDFNIPVELIARTPEDMAARLCHTLDLDSSSRFA